MPRRRNSFNDALEILRRTALAYADAMRSAVSGLPISANLLNADRALRDAAIDFTMIAQLRLAKEDKRP